MDDSPDSSPTAVFEALWTQFDQRYSLFDVKGIDWDSIHDVYAPRAAQSKNDAELFSILSEMLNTLQDGHVNLISDFDISHDDLSFDNSYRRRNIDINVVATSYLTSAYHTRGGFAYNTIADGDVLFIRYSSFSNSASTDDLRYILLDNESCLGVIFDIRQNSGGSIDNIWNILSVMPSTGQDLYYTQIKTGPAHNDFSPVEARKAPASVLFPYGKPVAVLVDRGTFSAASFFALSAKTYPNMALIGDTTGGGLGLPASGQLPNGWFFRLSVTRTLSASTQQPVDCIPPDRLVLLSKSATERGVDNVIEDAIDFIRH